LNNWHAAEIGAIQAPSSPVHFILNLHKWPNIWDAKINFNALSTKVRMTILAAGITGSLVSRKKSLSNKRTRNMNKFDPHGKKEILSTTVDQLKRSNKIENPKFVWVRKSTGLSSITNTPSCHGFTPPQQPPTSSRTPQS
jgi:hypothetical protein